MNGRVNALIVAVALLIAVVVGLATAASPLAPPIPYASASAAPDGTLALYRWVAALGFHPRRLTAGPWRSEELAGLGALFVLEPRLAFTPGEVMSVLRWIRGGGTLVLLQDGGDAALPGALGLVIRSLPGSATATTSTGPAPYGAAPLQPLLAHPPLLGLSVTVRARVQATVPSVVTVLGNGGLPAPGGTSGNVSGTAGPSGEAVVRPDARAAVLVYDRVGQGQVYAGSTPGVLTNGTIARGDNRRLVPNVLAGLPAGAQVGFDDYHLVVPSVATPAPATLAGALTTTGWGRALLYAVALVCLYIVLTGRRLGRPLRPVPERGRSLAEYVVSMATLFRRAALRSRVLALWQDSLRRDLAGPGGVRGRSDAELVAEAAGRAGLAPHEQSEALALLRSREGLGERRLVDLCGRIARLQERLAQRSKR